MKKNRILAAVAAAIIGISGLPAAAGAQEVPALPQIPGLPPVPPIALPAPGAGAPAPLPLPAILPPAPVAAPPEINGDVRESYVSFGDSLAANPTVTDIAVNKAQKAGLPVPWRNIRPGFCAQGPNNFPAQTAQKTGLRLVDYSCGGATAYVQTQPTDPIPHDTLADQVDCAIANNHLNGDTRLVSVSIGVNDTYQMSNLNVPDTDGRQQRYRDAVIPALNRSKQAAPGAKVVLLGIPDQTDDHNQTCATNLYGVVSHWYFPIVSNYQEEVRNEQRDSANAAGVQFLDMADEISAASGLNGCSPNPQRRSAAVFDDAPHRFTFHLTDAGHGYYSDRLAQVYHG